MDPVKNRISWKSVFGDGREAKAANITKLHSELQEAVSEKGDWNVAVIWKRQGMASFHGRSPHPIGVPMKAEAPPLASMIFRPIVDITPSR